MDSAKAETETKAEANASAKNNELTETEKALYEDARESVVNIVVSHFHKGKQVMGSAGSGFFVSDADAKLPQCMLVTDNHVIDIDPQLTVTMEVQLDDGTKLPAKVLKQDPAHDLAFLQLEGVTDAKKQCKALQVSDDELTKGERVLRLNRTRWEPEVFPGIYKDLVKRRDQELNSDLRDEDMDRDLHQFEIYNNLGHQFSGGPYINKNGEVVGVHEGGLGLATPAKDLQAELDKLAK